ERGVEAVALDQVATLAGMPAGELRCRYGDTRALLAALRDRFVARFCDRLERAMQRCRPDDWPGRLRAWTVAAFDGYLEEVALHDVVFHGTDPHDREALRSNPVVDQLAALLRAGVEARAWAAPDPGMTATIFFNALHAAVDRVVAEGAPYRRQQPLQTLIGYFDRSVQWWRQA